MQSSRNCISSADRSPSYVFRAVNSAQVPQPAFHLTPRIGWMNDPNGFSYYKGQYHLFYQYHPYDSHWGPMHWGHAEGISFCSVGRVRMNLAKWDLVP